MPAIISDTQTDFKFQTITHTATSPFIYAVAHPVLNAHVRNFTLVINSDSEYGMELMGFRNCVFENINIQYNGDPAICKALILLQSGDKTGDGGTGGCHYNIFRNIRLSCGGAKRGVLIKRGGTQGCNANAFYDFKIHNPSRTGFDLNGGIGNHMYNILVEGRADSKPKFGILFRNGHHNTLFGYYVENAQLPFFLNNEVGSHTYGGYERA